MFLAIIGVVLKNGGIFPDDFDVRSFGTIPDD